MENQDFAGFMGIAQFYIARLLAQSVESKHRITTNQPNIAHKCSPPRQE
jgi:hypothetical protein